MTTEPKAPRRHELKRAGHLLQALLAAVLGASILMPPEAVATEHLDATCNLTQRSAPHTVISIIDAATLMLDDGTHVRLAGVLAPSLQDLVQPAIAWSPEIDARRALADAALGRTITLANRDSDKDRNGNVLAQVFVETAGRQPLWLQGEMLAKGHMRAAGLPGRHSCMDDLLAAEAPARNLARGLWSDPVYALRNAHRSFDLLNLRGTFQLVEGRVKKVQRAKSGRIYINFGSNWRTDFSASVPASVSSKHPAWASRLLDLSGRRLLVRGWIDRRNGPMIDIEDPSQIEVIGGSPPRRSGGTKPEAEPAESPPRRQGSTRQFAKPGPTVVTGAVGDLKR